MCDSIVGSNATRKLDSDILALVVGEPIQEPLATWAQPTKTVGEGDRTNGTRVGSSAKAAGSPDGGEKLRKG
jgi:hypothetical protein